MFVDTYIHGLQIICNITEVNKFLLDLKIVDFSNHEIHEIKCLMSINDFTVT